ncbi:hypothetical protein HJG60_008194 [Phyllostomus discolor]|uniref:Uncharacterized protein n=1 Tax=Phyllostomus discolor TaxID=89673 RepID=A0A833Z3X4_9CHIR|nr:hypothetical protein HJG60_008194 [Phyllostomus discolor]
MLPVHVINICSLYSPCICCDFSFCALKCFTSLQHPLSTWPSSAAGGRGLSPLLDKPGNLLGKGKGLTSGRRMETSSGPDLNAAFPGAFAFRSWEVSPQPASPLAEGTGRPPAAAEMPWSGVGSGV